MTNNHDRPTDTIKAKLQFRTTKAISLLLWDYHQVYVPESIIHNLEDIDFSNTEEEQVFSVEYWFLEKNNLVEW